MRAAATSWLGSDASLYYGSESEEFVSGRLGALTPLPKLLQQSCPWDRLCDHTKAPRRPEGDVAPHRCLLVCYSELAALPCQHIG